MISKSKKRHIGSFRQRLSFQSESTTSDGLGGQTVDWVESFKAWCNVKPISGTQKLHLDGLQNEVSHLIETRKGLSFSPDMRVQYKGRTFQLHSVINKDEDNAIIEIGASELDES